MTARATSSLLAQAVVLAALALSIVTVLAEEPTEGTRAQIVYLSGDQVYIDAGAKRGVRVGDRFPVLRDGKTMSVIEVLYVSTHHALCITREPEVELLAGDEVLLRSHSSPELRLDEIMPPKPEQTDPDASSQQVHEAAIEAMSADAAGTETRRVTVRKHRRRRSKLREIGLRGRVGFRFLSVRDRSGLGGGFRQPALDLRIDGYQIGGSPFDANVDVRSRRTYRSSPAGDESVNRTRVYRLGAAWNEPAVGIRVSLGRQYSAALSAVSIFDGAMLEYGRQRWRLGAFSGTQPDPVDFGYSSAVREHGAFFQLHGPRESSRRWKVTTGVVGSYQQGEINREFIYVLGTYTTRRFSLYATEEIDVNRDWKADAGESTISPTNTFLNMSWRVSDSLSLTGGYDDRRNVRLYRDLVTPETEFDDSNRRGVWLGANAKLKERFRVGVNTRLNDGGSSGSSESYTLRLGVDRLSVVDLAFRTRSTRFTNQTTEGWLHSVTGGLNLGARAHLDVTAGIRRQQNLRDPERDSNLEWYGADVDFRLGRLWYLMLSWERNAGTVENNDQFYSSLTYRF